MMNKRWRYLPQSPVIAVESLSKQLGIPKKLCALLLQRELKEREAIEEFLHPSLARLHAPMKMKDMPSAVARVMEAVANQEAICVYGDYDVDGVTAVALLYKALKKAGATVSYYLPSRHKEGYGISQAGVKYCIDKGINLLISVDCGIRALDKIKAISQAGTDVIVCDHHQPGPALPPALAILNPKQKNCPYPFKELSGCGIAFKLLQGLALEGLLDEQEPLKYLDLVAISIAADIVPIIGENRILAAAGLKDLETNPNLGLATLMKECKLTPPYTISAIVFFLAPKINAPGRISHPEKALNLLLASNEEEAKKWANALLTENQTRKAIENTLMEEVQALISQNPHHRQQATTVLFQPQWHKGVLGIAAARSIEYFYKPTIILTQKGNEAVGSARSVVGYNIYQAIQQCSHLLTAFGGHAYAAGLRLPLENIKAFQKSFEATVQQSIRPHQLIPEQVIDQVVDLREITTEFYQNMQKMRPFGPKHRQPVFASGPITIKSYQLYKNEHLALRLQQGNDPNIWRAIGFFMAEYLPLVKTGVPLAIAYTIQENVYRGNLSYQLFLKGIKAFADANI